MGLEPGFGTGLSTAGGQGTEGWSPRLPPVHPEVAPMLLVGVTVPTPVPSGEAAPCVG